jgi:L-alanine-DL-glutamate epimerase-like enolase superfamily enzyme
MRKAYNVPAWQLLGGRYRDKVRLYADTPEAGSVEEQKKLINYRINDQGYTWLKMDVSIAELKGKPGTLVNAKPWENSKGDLAQWGDQNNPMSYANTLHPFTQIQITEKGLEELAAIVESTRKLIGYDIPISTDHYGHFDMNNGITVRQSRGKIPLSMAGRYCFLGINQPMENHLRCFRNPYSYRRRYLFAQIF